MPSVQADVPLAPFTTLGLGGPAQRFVDATTAQELVAEVREVDAAIAPSPLLLLAGGSNVVIADEGLRRHSSCTSPRAACSRSSPGGVRLRAAAGEPWDELVAAASAAGLAGHRVPRPASPAARARPRSRTSAPTGRRSQRRSAACASYDRETGTTGTLDGPTNAASATATAASRATTATSCSASSFDLERCGARRPIRYAELARTLGVEVGARAPLAARARRPCSGYDAARGWSSTPPTRTRSAPARSSRTPMLDADAFAALERAPPGGSARRPAAAGWPEADGRVKTSAAWLIERAGFARGTATGPHVAISTKHTLALTTAAARARPSWSRSPARCATACATRSASSSARAGVRRPQVLSAVSDRRCAQARARQPCAAA